MVSRFRGEASENLCQYFDEANRAKNLNKRNIQLRLQIYIGFS